MPSLTSNFNFRYSQSQIKQDMYKGFTFTIVYAAENSRYDGVDLYNNLTILRSCKERTAAVSLQESE